MKLALALLVALASCAESPCEHSCAELADACGAAESVCVDICEEIGEDRCADCSGCLSARDCDVMQCLPECSDC